MTDGVPPDLQALGITKRFGPLTALKDVNFQLRSGRFHALLGENGAGKSTLVKCIMGYYHPDEGKILLNQQAGHDSQPARCPDIRHRDGLSAVHPHPQHDGPREPGDLQGEDWTRSSIGRKKSDQLTQFMEKMPFKVSLTARVSSLAAGEKQKVEILKQLALQNRILILDEPTSVLTPQEADEILGHLRAMTLAQQLSVLIITHKLREVAAFADEVTVLRKGQFVGSGNVSELKVSQMAEMMVGSEVTAKPKQRTVASHKVPKLRSARSPCQG